jgi:hypothetical protein
MSFRIHNPAFNILNIISAHRVVDIFEEGISTPGP